MVEGYYVCLNGKQHRIYTGYAETDCGDYYPDWYEIDESTICQYAGLTDKDGNKIWENDVVRSGINLVVTWNEKFASWCITKKGWAYNHFFGEAVEPQDCEVIGNIFDNPELLGGAENG